MDNTPIDFPFSNMKRIKYDKNETLLNINDMNNKVIGNLNERYDRSVLTSIDPDINVQSSIDSLYYNEKTFNNKCQGNNKLSFIHINIRSAPKNL